MAHVLHYAFKSTQATVQLVLASVLGVLAVLLLFSTVFRWRFEATLREAIADSARADGEPLALLEEARSARPDDLLPSLFTGQLLLERGMRSAEEKETGKEPPTAEMLAPAIKALNGSIKAFDLACSKRDKASGPTSESAAVGACCARLALADLDVGQRGALIEEAAKVLETQVRDKDDADVAIAAVGVAWARGDLAACAQKLSDASAKIASAGRGALGSYYWHKGLVGLLNHDPGALDDLRRSSLFRRGPQSGRVIALAFRVAASNVSGKDPKEVEAQLTALGEILAQRGKATTRYEFEKGDEAACWNALGGAWMKVPNGVQASQCFQRATGYRPDMVLYKVNNALAVRAKAETVTEGMTPEQAHRRFDTECANALFDIFSHWDITKDSAAEKDAHTKYARDGLLLAVGLYHGAARDPEAQPSMELAHSRYELEDKDFFRMKGALTDWAKRLDQAIGFYKKAIDLGHRDSYKMQERVDMWEQRQKGGR